MKTKTYKSKYLFISKRKLAFIMSALFAATSVLTFFSEKAIENVVGKVFGDEATIADFAYDANEDVFYSVVNSWQRKYGYCMAYDEACAPCSMIIDCEPVYFKYNNRYWLIELWKGQYGMTCGGEIGIYYADIAENISINPQSVFYKVISDSEMLQMSFTIFKNNEKLFSRSALHWWLTGFRLGEFADTDELILKAEIKIDDAGFLNAFVSSLYEKGYSSKNVTIENGIVNIVFDEPYSEQSEIRDMLEKSTQKRNKLLCDEFQKLTANIKSTPDKLKYIKENNPEMYDKAGVVGDNILSIEKG